MSYERRQLSLQWGEENTPAEAFVTLEDGTVEQRVNYSVDEYSNTKLHICAHTGNFVAACLLISRAKNLELLDLQNRWGRTALHEAVSLNQHAIARILLLCGANPLIFDENGFLPIHIACNYLDCVDALVAPFSKDEIAFRKEIMKGHDFSEAVQYNQVDLPTENGVNCVHIAAKANHLDILKYLIENGANVNAPTRMRRVTALHVAIEEQNDEIFDYLSKCPGVDVNAENNHGITPYQFADLLRRTSLKDALKDLGAVPATSPAEYPEDYVLGYEIYEEDSDDSDFDVGYRTDTSGVESDYSELDEDF